MGIGWLASIFQAHGVHRVSNSSFSPPCAIQPPRSIEFNYDEMPHLISWSRLALMSRGGVESRLARQYHNHKKTPLLNAVSAGAYEIVEWLLNFDPHLVHDEIAAGNSKSPGSGAWRLASNLANGPVKMRLLNLLDRFRCPHEDSFSGVKEARCLC